MEQGRVSRENVEASSQFEDEQMLRGELNTMYQLPKLNTAVH
jgi:hypothetical protein